MYLCLVMTSPNMLANQFTLEPSSSGGIISLSTETTSLHVEFHVSQPETQNFPAIDRNSVRIEDGGDAEILKRMWSYFCRRPGWLLNLQGAMLEAAAAIRPAEHLVGI